MEDKVKFGFIDVGKSNKVLEFKKKYLGIEGKFIQVKINGEEYIRVGYLGHRKILEETLNEFKLKFDTKSYGIPLEKGNNYKLIGAGKIEFLGDKLNFYDYSRDYFDKVKGANRKNLEEMFGAENLTEGREGLFGPSFLVKI